jgi:hypothetical protein
MIGLRDISLKELRYELWLDYLTLRLLRHMIDRSCGMRGRLICRRVRLGSLRRRLFSVVWVI